MEIERIAKEMGRVKKSELERIKKEDVFGEIGECLKEIKVKDVE